MFSRFVNCVKQFLSGNDIGLVIDYNLTGNVPYKNRKQRRDEKRYIKAKRR